MRKETKLKILNFPYIGLCLDSISEVWWYILHWAPLLQFSPKASAFLHSKWFDSMHIPLQYEDSGYPQKCELQRCNAFAALLPFRIHRRRNLTMQCHIGKAWQSAPWGKVHFNLWECKHPMWKKNYNEKSSVCAQQKSCQYTVWYKVACYT